MRTELPLRVRAGFDRTLDVGTDLLLKLPPSLEFGRPEPHDLLCGSIDRNVPVAHTRLHAVSLFVALDHRALHAFELLSIAHGYPFPLTAQRRLHRLDQAIDLVAFAAQALQMLNKKTCPFRRLGAQALGDPRQRHPRSAEQQDLLETVKIARHVAPIPVRHPPGSDQPRLLVQAQGARTHSAHPRHRADTVPLMRHRTRPSLLSCPA